MCTKLVFWKVHIPYCCIWEGSVFKGKIVRTVEEVLWYCLQGKSALWSHLSNYQELKECNDTSKPIDPNLLTPGEYIWIYGLYLSYVTDGVVVQALVPSCTSTAVVLQVFGGSGSLVFSCATGSVALLVFGVQDHLCSVVPPVQLRYWSLVVQGHLCSVVPVVQLRYWCLVVQGHLCCSTSSVVWLELVLFSWLVNLFICSFIHLFVCSLRENIIDTLCSTVITVTDNGSSRWSTNCVYRIIRCEFIQNSSEKWGVPCNCAHSWHILSWKLKIVMGRRESLLHICCIFT